MRIRSVFVAIAATFALVGVAVPTASAQAPCPSGQYPPNATALQLSSSAVFPGDQVLVTGVCFTANATIGLEFRSTPSSLGSAQTDGAGSFSRTITVPSNASVGVHSIVAIDNRREVSASINVLARTGGGGTAPVAGGGGTALPRTGPGFAIPAAIAALALILLGTMAIMASKRKRAAA